MPQPSRTPEALLDAAMTSLPANSSPFVVLRISLCPHQEEIGLVSPLEDALLEQAQQRLQTSIREHESAVLLPNGELMAVLCSIRSVIRAGAAADRLADLLQQPFCIQGRRVKAIPSIGVALSPYDGRLAPVLASRAALALQHAKAAGSGIVQFYDAAMEEEQHRALPLHIRSALLFQQWQAGQSQPLRTSGLSLAASAGSLHIM